MGNTQSQKNVEPKVTSFSRSDISDDLKKEAFTFFEEVSKEFIEAYCAVGDQEMCENPRILTCVFDVYLRRKIADHPKNTEIDKVYTLYTFTSADMMTNLLRSMQTKFTLIMGQGTWRPIVYVLDKFQEDLFTTRDAVVSGIIGIRLPCKLRLSFLFHDCICARKHIRQNALVVWKWNLDAIPNTSTLS